ncbi:MAG: hypothetical protein ACFBZ8_06290 [Opitutales bacterium]
MIRLLWIPLLANALLIFLSSQLAHWLAPWGLAVYLGGLLLIYPVMHLPIGISMLIAAASGLLLDAASVQPFGLSYGIFTLIVAMSALVGRRLRAEAPLHLWILGLVLNALCLLLTALALSWLKEGLGGGAYWLQVFSNLVVSTLVAAGLALWFVSLQRALVSMVPRPGGSNAETTMAEAITRTGAGPKR